MVRLARSLNAVITAVIVVALLFLAIEGLFVFFTGRAALWL